MSLLDISESKNIGLVKELDEASIDLIFSNLQESQYSFPIKSFIREIFSNALDSIREKEIAFDIIMNGTDVNKYFVTRFEDVVIDSNFDASYYDFSFLDMESKKVEIVYTRREEAPKDLITILDKGVGLSSERLRNYLKLGWSSKRNTKYAIGKFGIGAKSGLATGAEFFVVRTVYNGYTTSFMIYKEHFHCITKDDFSGYTEVWKGHSKEGTELEIPVVWNSTKAANGVTIELEVQSYTKDNYIRAIKEQLLYFYDRVSFFCEENSIKMEFEFLLEPEFDSNNCIVTKSSIMSEPHLVLDGVNYGIISWSELGMEKRYGNIGIKVSPSDIDVNQSRENVIWSEKTKTTVLAKIQEVTKDAELYLQDKISYIENYFEWCGTMGQTKSKVEGELVLHTFKRFVPKANLNLVWEFKDFDTLDGLAEDFRFLNTSFFSDYNVEEYFTLKNVYLNSYRGKTVIAQDNVYAKDLNSKIVVYASEKSINIEFVEYILKKYSISNFYYLRPAERSSSKATYFNAITVFKYLLEKYAINLDTFEYPQEYFDELARKEEAIKAEKERIAQEERERKRLERESKKKATNITTEVKITVKNVYWKSYNKFYRESTQKIWKSHDSSSFVYNMSYDSFTLDSLRKSGTNIFAKTSDAGILKAVVAYLASSKVIEDFEGYNFIIVSQDNYEFLRKQEDFIPLEKFIMNEVGDTLTLHELFVQYNTRRILSELFAKHHWLKPVSKLKGIDDDFDKLVETFDSYKSIALNVREGTRDLILSAYTALTAEQTDIFNALDQYLKNTEIIHRLISEGKTDELKDKSKELFGSDVPLTITAFDEKFINTIESFIKKVEPIVDILLFLDYDSMSMDDITNVVSILNKLL